MLPSTSTPSYRKFEETFRRNVPADSLQNYVGADSEAKGGVLLPNANGEVLLHAKGKPKKPKKTQAQRTKMGKFLHGKALKTIGKVALGVGALAASTLIFNPQLGVAANVGLLAGKTGAKAGLKIGGKAIVKKLAKTAGKKLLKKGAKKMLSPKKLLDGIKGVTKLGKKIKLGKSKAGGGIVKKIGGKVTGIFKKKAGKLPKVKKLKLPKVKKVKKKLRGKLDAAMGGAFGIQDNVGADMNSGYTPSLIPSADAEENSFMDTIRANSEAPAGDVLPQIAAGAEGSDTAYEYVERYLFPIGLRTVRIKAKQ